MRDFTSNIDDDSIMNARADRSRPDMDPGMDDDDDGWESIGSSDSGWGDSFGGGGSDSFDDGFDDELAAEFEDDEDDDWEDDLDPAIFDDPVLMVKWLEKQQKEMLSLSQSEGT